MADFGYIQIVRVCNQHCIFCSNPSNGSKLSLGEIIKLIDTYHGQNLAGVIFTGGEPTMHEQLPKLIRYCRKKNFDCKIITNGQRLAYKAYLDALISAGLQQFHLSIYSHKPSVQNLLTQNSQAIKNLEMTFLNLNDYPNVHVAINITINKFNQDHLDKLVAWILKKYPLSQHFVFNNLDPRNLKSNDDLSVIPDLPVVEKSLDRALAFLQSRGKTFRVERVPLCFMKNYMHFSTETRKIAKEERRSMYFLDGKGRKIQDSFYRLKAAKCGKCSVNDICAGVDGDGKQYDLKLLSPLHISKEKKQEIINNILNS